MRSEPNRALVPRIEHIADAMCTRSLIHDCKESGRCLDVTRGNRSDKREPRVAHPFLRQRMAFELPRKISVVRADAMVQCEYRLQRRTNRFGCIEDGGSPLPVSTELGAANRRVDVGVERTSHPSLSHLGVESLLPSRELSDTAAQSVAGNERMYEGIGFQSSSVPGRAYRSKSVMASTVRSRAPSAMSANPA